MKVPDAFQADLDGPAVHTGSLLGRERWLILHTGLAEAMFKGRKGIKDKRDGRWLVSPIIGLRQFGNLLRGIWLEARRGDPYAHWWLIRVEEALDSAEHEMCVSTELYERRLAEGTTMDVEVLGALEPHQHRIRFLNPLGHRGANLLGQFDRLLNVIIECHQQALLGTNDLKWMQRAGRRSVLGAFSTVFGYRAFEITHSDIVNHTARGQRAVEHMGVVPKAILTGDRTAKCALPRATVPR